MILFRFRNWNLQIIPYLTHWLASYEASTSNSFFEVSLWFGVLLRFVCIVLYALYAAQTSFRYLIGQYVVNSSVVGVLNSWDCCVKWYIHTHLYTCFSVQLHIQFTRTPKAVKCTERRVTGERGGCTRQVSRSYHTCSDTHLLNFTLTADRDTARLWDIYLEMLWHSTW